MRLRAFPGSIWGLVGLAAIASALLTCALGFSTYWVVHEEIERQLDHRIEVETSALLDLYETGGFPALAQAVQARDRRAAPTTGYLAAGRSIERGMGYMLIDASGRRQAGAIDAQPPREGWSEFLHFRRPNGSPGVAQALNSPLKNGGRLVVAADRAIVGEMDRTLLKMFTLSFGLILVLGVATAAALGRIIQRRLSTIQSAAETIMAGDMERRMPLDGSGGEFDRLSVVLNRMLDRIAALVDNLRQVSSDIAHDMRTPLNRLRVRLEEAEAKAADTDAQPLVVAATAEADELLGLFSALLAISEVEGQSVRSRFRPVPLDRVIAVVAEAYEPAFENAGMTLATGPADATVLGDAQLLQRCLAGILDNALTHTSKGVTVRIVAERRDDHVLLRIEDNGPGVPEADRERVFQRFARLDRSRSTPGHGLGLSMVSAIVAAHRGEVRIVPAPVGLVIEITFPNEPSQIV